MKVISIGAGPAALYFSILARQRFPSWDITLLERNARGDTFGFGVVFSDETLSNLLEADPPTHAEITASFAHWEAIDVHIRGETFRSAGHGFSGISRRRLLDILEARATPRNCGNRKFGAARPLRWNETLATASRLHAEDMARNNYFSHGGRDGSNPAQRVERAGYKYRATGENIAAGQLSAEDAVAGWIKSPGHCANLMNPGFTEMGAGLAVDHKSELGVYWAQAFGTPR